MKPFRAAAILGLASSGILAAFLLAQDTPPPAPPPSPSPAEQPAGETQPLPPSATPAGPPNPREKPPKIVRVVCTDHICGHCDGKCHRNGGHVAVDKNGHCACTPDEGSALDRATRDAYEKKQPQ